MRFGLAALLALMGFVTAGPAAPQDAPSKAQKMQDKAVTDVPHCVRKHGTISIRNGDDAAGWSQYNLAPPEKLLRVLVQRSGCFNIVDRAAGLGAATEERNLNNGLGLQRGSNVGLGQVKAADYVLVAEVQAQNSNASGNGLAAGLGGLFGGKVGAMVGGIKTRKLEANTVLSLTNVRTTETIAVTEGHAAKNDMSWSASGAESNGYASASTGGFFASGSQAMGAVGGGYENTDIGKIVTLSFIDAYSKIVGEVETIQAGSTGTAESSPKKTFTAIAPVAIRARASASAKVIRTLPPGATVYPTGNKDGLWWEIADENDNIGWVLNTKLEPAR